MKQPRVLLPVHRGRCTEWVCGFHERVMCLKLRSVDSTHLTSERG